MRGWLTRLDGYLVAATTQNGQLGTAGERRPPLARRLRVAAALALPTVACLVATWLPWYSVNAPSGGDGPLAQSDLLFYGVADWRTAVPVMTALALTGVFGYALLGNGTMFLRVACGLMAIVAGFIVVAIRDRPIGAPMADYRVAIDSGAWIGFIAAMTSAAFYAFLSGFRDARSEIESLVPR